MDLVAILTLRVLADLATSNIGVSRRGVCDENARLPAAEVVEMACHAF